MISFTVNPLFVLDLRDDFLVNDSKKLYEFIGKDPVKAFHLGVHVAKWFDLLDRKQQYLHSKLLRHNQEEIEPYMDQLKHWTEAFPHSSKDDQINIIELSEYVFNNMIFSSEVWKDIIGYEELYQVSNLSRVRSCNKVIKNRKTTRE